MKKVIAILAAVAGILLIAAGSIFRMKESASIGIIGGADGPTAIFVAGKLGDGIFTGIILAGIVLAVVGVVVYKFVRKK